MILTFASSKGGVGKSTTCACLAGALAARGDKVHIMDLDKNATLSRWNHQFPMDGIEVSKIDKDEFADQYEATADRTDIDHILIDVAGHFEKALVMAIGAADLVIIPAQASEPDVFEAAKIIREIKALERNFGTKKAYGLLLTKLEALPTKVLEFVVGQIAEMGLTRFQSTITHRTIYKEMFLNGDPPHVADPAGKAAVEIDAVLDEAIRLYEAAGAPAMAEAG